MRQRAAVYILKLTADWNTVCNARRSDVVARRQFGQEMCRGVALDRGVGRQHDLSDRALE